MQTGWQKTEKGRWTWAINYPPWESICSTGAVDQWWHCDTHSFLYSFVGAPQSNNSFLVFFFPLVSLSLSEVVTTDLLSAKVRLCVKDRHYITSAVNKVKWCYAHAIRLSFTESEKTALKHSWSEWGLLSRTPPSALPVTEEWWRFPDPCIQAVWLTAPPFLLLESDIHVFNFSLLQVEPLLLVPPTFFFPFYCYLLPWLLSV